MEGGVVAAVNVKAMHARERERTRVGFLGFGGFTVHTWSFLCGGKGGGGCVVMDSFEEF